MGPNGLVPSLLVFGTIPSFKSPFQAHPNQVEDFKALNLAVREMEATVAKERTKKCWKANYLRLITTLLNLEITHGYIQQKGKRSEGYYEVTKVAHKIFSVTNSKKFKKFNISSKRLIAPTTDGHDLKHDMQNISKLSITPEPETRFHMDALLKSAPRYNLDDAKVVVKDEIQVLLRRGTFELFDEQKRSMECKCTCCTIHTGNKTGWDFKWTL